MTLDNELFDRALLSRRRARMARAISGHDFLLARVGDELRARLEAILRNFPIAVDLGAHHGVLGDVLAPIDSLGIVIHTDHCLPLLAQCGGARIVCDEESLPFARQSLDLVVSGLALHAVNDLPGTLIQIRRALKPDGLFLAAVLGGRSLEELREAFMAAEAELQEGASPRIAPFADVRDFGALLQRAGFALPVADSDLLRVTYASPRRLMTELRAMGGGNVLHARSRTPLRRETLKRAETIYRERFGTADGRIGATFEIIYLTGWAPDESQQRPLRPGSAARRLSDVLGTVERTAGEKAGPFKR